MYTEAANHAGLAGIAKALLDQSGVPAGTSERGAMGYLAALRRGAALAGVEGYIVDDAHGMLGARSRNSTTLATALKGLITGVPATGVIVGANLAQDQILTGTTGDQVRLSGKFTVTCGGWPMPTRTEPASWGRLGQALHRALAFPRGPDQSRLQHLSTLTTLAEGSMNRPGLAIAWAKEAAEYAVSTDTVLDARALYATQRCITHAGAATTPPTTPGQQSRGRR